MVEASSVPTTDIWHDYGGANPHELVDYVNALESELERLGTEVHVAQAQRHTEEARLRQEVDEALKKVHELHGKLVSHRESDAHAMETAYRLKEKLHQSERIMQEQLKEEKEMESRIEDLELELEKKNDLIKYRRERDESVIKELEAENEALKRKAALSLMLGYLTDLYLQVQPEGKAAAIFKVVQKLQRELENQNLNLKYGSKQTENESNSEENDIKRLIDVSGITQNEEHNISQEAPGSRRTSIESSTSKKVLGGSYGSNNRKSIDSSNGENGGDDHGEHVLDLIANDVKTPKLDFSNNRAKGDDILSPCTRFIVNCFGPSVNKSEDDAPVGTDQALSDHRTHIEVFEADPLLDIEHARLSGSMWAEIKLLNRRAAERAEMMNCSSQIKMMLGNLEKALASLVESDKPKTLKEPQTRHLAFIPKEGFAAAKKKHRAGATKNKFLPV